ncbi:MAG: sigma-54 dependent transcriptional regulator [Steroidobacteraceae bacterium]
MSATLLIHPTPHTVSLSVRAKAVIFADPESQQLLQQIERVAASDANVLIIGESGTGKELVAKHIHDRSGRSGPFLAVNCGALSESLAEAELFGHEAGAYTGATGARAGWFESANGGTLFLDEIGDLSPALQVKLLRVLQEREVVRVGSRKPVPLDLRLVAATNIDLAEAVTAGHFRRDLYYRLHVVKFELPPLRERTGDILPLVNHFLAHYSARLKLTRPALSPDARDSLLGYAWPGNIRELENVIHFALLMASGDVIRRENLRFVPLPVSAPRAGAASGDAFENIRGELQRLFRAPPQDLHQQLEQLLIRQAFESCEQNQVQTARLLGISRNILRTLLKKYGLIAASAVGA